MTDLWWVFALVVIYLIGLIGIGALVGERDLDHNTDVEWIGILLWPIIAMLILPYIGARLAREVPRALARFKRKETYRD